MLFNSLHFAAFFPVVAAVYFALPFRWRWAWLLAASYYFYMAWEPGYALLLAGVTLTAYLGGRFMGASPDPRWRRACFWGALGLSLGLLFFFKYYGFFSNTFRPLLGPFALPELRFLLPVGISFYTFQALSYSIEVYLGRQAPERHLGRFALYIAFFPTVLSGPIERPGSLLPQLECTAVFEYVRVTDGLKRMAWGLFQKVVIADRLAQLVDQVYGQPEHYPGPALCLATVFFAFQLFCDFSGYSDIAIGAAQVLGIRVRENFRQPYLAVSVADFWRRWHISLSFWLRDYLYLPLGGNRVPVPRWCANILIVFFLCGLWHGANWTFVVWGLLHAAYLMGGRLSTGLRLRLRGGREPGLPGRLAGIGLTFLLVSFAWIFFRADSLSAAGYIATHLVTGWGSVFDAGLWGDPRSSFGLWPRDWFLSFVFIVLILVVQVLREKGLSQAWLNARPLPFRWAVYSALLWGIFLFGALRQTEFLYFQF